MTSLFVPAGQADMLNQLVLRDFPNLVLVDIAQIMAQVQKMMDQAASAIQFVFLFTLAAGLVVLYAAIASTRDEAARIRSRGHARAVGASRRRIAATQFAEFALMGALAGLLAAGSASVLGHVLATRVLNMPVYRQRMALADRRGRGQCGHCLRRHVGRATRACHAAYPRFAGERHSGYRCKNARFSPGSRMKSNSRWR